MFLKLRTAEPDSNPWLQQDRMEQRKLVGTAIVFAGAALFGIGLLIYGLIAG